MEAIVADRPHVHAPPFPVARRDCAMLDPLDVDQPSDEVVVTTRRGMVRLALVATEAAGRFQREGVPHDPMAWMLAPRRLFGGAAAIDACVDRAACLRGVLVHGLSLGLDADPREVDDLVEGDDAMPGEDVETGGGSFPVRSRIADGDAIGGDVMPFRAPAGARPRLFSATVVAEDGIETLHAFHASLACDASEVAGRLSLRIGAASADAVIVEGFDAGLPLVTALVSPAIADTLSLVAADPASPLAAGLDLNIEQRFLC